MLPRRYTDFLSPFPNGIHHRSASAEPADAPVVTSVGQGGGIVASVGEHNAGPAERAEILTRNRAGST